MFYSIVPCFQEITYRDPIHFFSFFNEQEGSIFLDSANYVRPFQNTNRYSYIALSPFETIVLKNGIVKDVEGVVTNPFHLLKERSQHFNVQKISHLPPFQGGLAGYFAYDLCHYMENIPYPRMDDMYFPDMVIGFYDCVISFDHHCKKAWVVSTGFPELNDRLRQKRAKCRLVELVTLLNQYDYDQKCKDNTIFISSDDIVSNVEKKDYINIINVAKNYIISGDIFEVNLSHRFKTSLPQGLTAFELYKRLRKLNPTPFAAYLNLGKTIIASASPERFLLLEEGVVETRPIKGTMPRGKTIEEDTQFAEALLKSKKDYAENIMIVDLMRNDLSRVCTDDSVHVQKLCGLESFANVHHLVSVINGKLKPSADAFDVLSATIPGGSVTGAPKIRAMQIIAELETHRRGPYCGNIGYISFTGDMDTSVVIRTFNINDQIITYQVGGAIVLESDPEQEYQETLDKAYSMHQSLINESV